MEREEYAAMVLDFVSAIPPGRVATYGDIASVLGHGGPRRVGSVLSEYGDEVPWWRVIRAGGRPADPVGDRQLDRLREEGVLSYNGRVDLTEYRIDLDL